MSAVPIDDRAHHGRYQLRVAERDGMRFLVVRYRNGNLVAWRVPNRGYSITKARREGRMIPISTPSGIKSIKHLLDEASYYVRRHMRARA